MLNEQDTQAYLDRIHYQGPRTASLATLTALHLAHLQHIPFENLDISLGKKLDLSAHALMDKILVQRRGGFCYELNHAFALLLATLGFDVSRIAARVFNGKDYGPDFDHMLLQVRLENQTWIADVGFGDCFRAPLLLDGEGVHELGMHYQVQPDDGGLFVLMQGKDDGSTHPQYRFSLQAYAIDDFEAMCIYQQTSPDSHFTQKSICSIATPHGRVSISNSKCIITDAGKRSVRSIHGEEEYRSLLLKHFGVNLAADTPVVKLMAR
ncbi:arylamine N-acetyltransferase family protein [Undibacterium sp. TJN19]|uniref:arylamine N-acetyltransferase family protein n=1 Tax=Undibacterium sp. TJN19 TaxID=3413055 RepID=UPI003BF08758